jgi:hypothetical protein
VSEGKEAGVTGTYLTTRFVVGVPPDRPTFDDPSGRKIAVERIDTTAAMLKEEGAVPVPVEDLSAAEMPIAAYEWLACSVPSTTSLITRDSVETLSLRGPGRE